MGLQAIEAAPKDGNPIFLMYQDTGDMTTAHWAVRESGSFQRAAASIAFSPTHWLLQPKTVESSRGISTVVARASVAIGVCVLWLFIGALGNNALGGESNTRAKAFVPPTEMQGTVAQRKAMRDKSLRVPRIVETALVEQKQILEFSREKSGVRADRLAPIRQLDAAQGKVAQAPQSAPPWEPKQALEHEQECEGAEDLARALTSSLRGELDELRSAAEGARIKQKEALDQERDRADALARELTSLWVELDKTGIVGPESAQTAEAQKKQKEALEQERGRAEALAHELTSLRAELDAARTAGSGAVQAAEAEKKQKQALEQELEQERSKAEALGRELTSLRPELDMTRAVQLERVQAAEAKVAKERDKSETLARELASTRKEAEEGSALLAAAHAEVLQVTETNRATAAEQKQALASERDRADALSRELTSVRNQLEAGNRQIAALNTQHALAPRESAVDSSPERMAESSLRTIQAKQPLPKQQISGEAASTSGPSGSESPPPGPQSTAREPSSDLVSKVAMATEQSKSASAASRSVVDEQRLLARANTLLGRADISGARLLLEHALEGGSARAAFMLAETYDARVLRSWHAHGISGDLTKARELYERAQAGGIEDAKERLESLK